MHAPKTTPTAAILCAALATTLLPSAASAQSILYPDRAAFNAAVPQASLETFEKARAVNTNVTGPIDSSSTITGGNGQTVFLPGDITPGIRFDNQYRESFGSTFDSRIGATTGSAIFQTPSAGNSLIATFTPAEHIRNFALDAYQFNTAGPVTVSVFGASGLLHSAQVTAGPTTPGFFGITTSSPITRVTVSSSAIVPGIDNVAFAAQPLGYTTSSAAFNTLIQNATLETLSNIRLLNTNFTGPASSTSTNLSPSGQTIIAPGDLAPGISLDSRLHQSFNDTFNLRARSVSGNTILTTPSANDDLIINFTAPDVTAASLDVYQFNNPGTVTIDIYGDQGLHLGTTTAPANALTPSFVGITSPFGVPIRQLVISSDAILPAIDNIRFGTFIPEPTPLSLLLPTTLLLTRRKPR